MPGNSGPGYSQNPAHKLTMDGARRRVEVRAGGEILAETDDAIVLHESGHSPVFYLPRAAARMDRLKRSDRHTHCPFKGEASYFSLGDGSGDNIVWTYEQPYDEVLALKDRLAFYPDKVEITTP